jgi:hypothetical protein
MKKTRRNPTLYLESLPPEVRAPMQRLDRILSRIFKGKGRRLWEGVFWGGTPQAIIGYGDFTQARPRGTTVEWFMVGLALQKNYISLYVNAVEGGQYLSHKYKSRLGKVKVGSASISFRKLEDVDLDALTELVTTARKQLP